MGARPLIAMESSDEPRPVESFWHLDRRVPIVLVVVIAVQIVTMSWWAAALSTRVDQLERAQMSSATQAERLIRVEEKIGVLQQSITEIKNIISQPAPRR